MINKEHGNSKGRSKSTTIKMHPLYHEAAKKSLSNNESFSDFLHEAIYHLLMIKNPDVIRILGVDTVRRKFEIKHLSFPDIKIPRWANGLPKNISIALINYGYNGRVRIKIDVAEGVDFSSIPGICKSDHDLIIEWSKR